MVQTQVVQHQQSPVVRTQLVLQRAGHVDVHLHRVRHVQIFHERLPVEVRGEQLRPGLVAVRHLCRRPLRVRRQSSRSWWFGQKASQDSGVGRNAVVHATRALLSDVGGLHYNMLVIFFDFR